MINIYIFSFEKIVINTEIKDISMSEPHPVAELKLPLVKWLANKGYDTRFEVKIDNSFADIVGYKENIILSIKLKDSLQEINKGIKQCLNYSKGSDYVYLAFPWYLLKDFNKKVNINFDFGIITINENDEIDLIKKSRRFKPNKKIKENTIDFLKKRSQTILPLFERFSLDNSLIKVPEVKRLIKNITTETLWIYILMILIVKPFHAYALRDIIKREFGFTPGRITIYKVLYKLEKRGYVKKVNIKKGSIKGPKRKYYKITEKGHELFEYGVHILNELIYSLTGM